MNNLSSDSGGGKMTGKILSPQEFKEHFDAVLSVNGANLAGLWEHPPNFATAWKKRGGIYDAIGEKINMPRYHGDRSDDYWTIEAVFFAENEELLTRKGNYATFLSVAMKHENIAANSYKEMNKLSILNASLKVLVTYPKHPNDPNQEEKNTLLDNYIKQIKSADVFGDFFDRRRQMVIFGYKENDTVRWEHHLYNGENFDLM